MIIKKTIFKKKMIACFIIFIATLFLCSISVNKIWFREDDLGLFINGLVGISKKKGVTMISEAVEIKRMNLQEFDFLFPTGFKIEPWDYFKVYN